VGATPPDDYELRSRDSVRELDPASDLSAMAVAFNLIRAANRLQRELERGVHRPAGISWAGFRVLFAVHVHGRLRPQDISDLTSVSAAGVSSVLNTLERDGLLVRRRGDAEDRRVVLVALTPAGERVVRTQWGRQNALESAWIGRLDADERAALAELLRALLARDLPAGP
jgi:DNA-binding MarR family transcriptional regulator